MVLKYIGNDQKVWKEIVISEKDVSFCDVGNVIRLRVWNTCSGLPLTLDYSSLEKLNKDWRDI